MSGRGLVSNQIGSRWFNLQNLNHIFRHLPHHRRAVALYHNQKLRHAVTSLHRLLRPLIFPEHIAQTPQNRNCMLRRRRRNFQQLPHNSFDAPASVSAANLRSTFSLRRQSLQQFQRFLRHRDAGYLLR